MTGLYLAGLASDLGGDRLSVRAAIHDGLYPRETAEADGYVSIVREDSRAPYEMALIAARAALAEAGRAGDDLAGLVYASIHRHGQPRLWSPASWLQRQLGAAGHVPALAVQQGCNGLVQAMMAFADLCRASPQLAVLFVGADRFDASGFDRWRSDYGLLYGDAAAAVVVSAKGGFARFLHLALDGAPELEELHRDAGFAPEGPGSWQTEYDVRRSKKAFLAAHGQTGFTGPLNAALARLKAGLLSDPAWAGPVDWVITPFVGSKIRSATYEAAFAELGRHSGWEIGKHLGHLGTTDGWVGLDQIRRSGAATPGDRVLIVSAGVGFSCGLALIELL